jgi:PAS domain S-box-containing protein
MLAAALDCVIVMDHRGVIVEFNAAAERTFGYRRADVIGREMAGTIIPPRLRDRHRQALARHLTTGENGILGKRIEMPAQRGDGSEILVELSVIRLETDSSPLFTGFLREVTELKRAEAVAHRSLSILQAVVEGTNDAVFVKDSQGRYLHINSAGARFLGASVDEVLGKDDRELFPADAAARIMAVDRQVMEGGGIHSFEESTELTGVARTFLATKGPYRDSAGNVIGVVGIARDITERKHSEDLMRESEQRFRAVFSHSSLGMSVVGLDGRYLEVNQALCECFGYSEAELKQHAFRDLTHPDDREKSLALLRRMLAGEMDTCRFEKRYIGKDGRVIWTLLNTALVRDRDGKPHYFVTQTEDISARREFEKTLQESETRFRKLFEESPISIQLFSPDGNTLAVNRAWMQLWDASAATVRDEVIGKYNVLTDPQLAARGIDAYVSRAFAGEATGIPVALYDPGEMGQQGRARWTEPVIYPLKDERGSVREVVLMHKDVTERVQAETTLGLLAETSALLATSLNLEATLERTAGLTVKYFGGWCLIHMLGEHEQIQRVVAHPEGELAARAEELERRHPVTRGASWGPGGVLRTGQAELFPRMLAGAALPAEGAEGALRVPGLKSYLCVPLRVTADHPPLGALSVISIDRLYNEQDLALAQELAHRASIAIENARLYRESQKATQLREDFVAIAAHELRTPLTPLKLQLQLLRSRLDTDTPVEGTDLLRLISSSDRQIDRLARLVEDMLDTSRINTGRFTLSLEPVDLSEIVRDLTERLHSELQLARCALELEAAPGVSGLWDRTRLEQVVANLLTNAMKYGKGKPVRVTVGSRDDRATLSVQDFGIGIAAEDQARIFERFERAVSMRTYGGLGLGLYLTRQIVEAHGGTIHVASELGKGSTFTVELPRAAPAPG